MAIHRLSLEEFHEAIRSVEGYTTPADLNPRPSPATGCIVSIRFHFGCLVRCALRGGVIAFQHKMSPRNWALTGFKMMLDMEAMGARCRFEGFSRLAEKPAPRVFIANHISLVETIILPPALMAFTDMTVVAKRSLAKYPVFGSAMQSVHPILVSRTNARQDLRDVIEQGVAAIKAGRSILLFPQSTRTTEFIPEHFNSLGVKLAQKADSIVTPIALKTDIAPPGTIPWLRDFGPVDLSREVRFACGPDFAPDAASLDASRSFIADTLAAWETTNKFNN